MNDGDSGETLRIGRFLARCGVASRRKTGELIESGRVRINGEVVTDLSRHVRPGEDTVECDGKPVTLSMFEVTLAYHKPLRVVVTRGDPEGRRTVYDLLPGDYRHLSPRLVYVGRLDFMSEGLLVMTTDGDLVQELTHPSRHVEKEYEAECDRPLTPAELERLSRGIELDGSATQPCVVQRIEPRRVPSYRVVLREGRNRQVRRMFDSIEVRITRLRRVRIGGLRLGDLPPGEWRELAPAEIALLRRP